MIDSPRADPASREALRARQGKGARYDAPNAPAEDLLLARRGAAFFARKLNELSDSDLNEDSLVPGWSRRHLIADVSYRARAMAIAIKGLRGDLTQEETEWTPPDLSLAATLPSHALKFLYAHSDVHLKVEFRDLTNSDWGRSVVLRGGRSVAVRDLPLIRAKSVWFGAFRLANGIKQADLPARILAESCT